MSGAPSGFFAAQFPNARGHFKGVVEKDFCKIHKLCGVFRGSVDFMNGLIAFKANMRAPVPQDAADNGFFFQVIQALGKRIALPFKMFHGSFQNGAATRHDKRGRFLFPAHILQIHKKDAHVIRQRRMRIHRNFFRQKPADFRFFAVVNLFSVLKAVPQFAQHVLINSKFRQNGMIAIYATAAGEYLDRDGGLSPTAVFPLAKGSGAVHAVWSQMENMKAAFFRAYRATSLQMNHEKSSGVNHVQN